MSYIVYSTAQMQRRTLVSKSIASAWIIADYGGMAPISLASINLILLGWILASEMSATPLWSVIVKAFAFCKREQVRRYIWAVRYIQYMLMQPCTVHILHI